MVKASSSSSAKHKEPSKAAVKCAMVQALRSVGMSTAQVAQTLGIAERTVRRHAQVARSMQAAEAESTQQKQTLELREGECLKLVITIKRRGK